MDALVESIRAARQAAWMAPQALALAAAGLYLAGLLKTGRGWRTGYTRKVFHMVIFTSAALVQIAVGVGGVYVFGLMTTLVLAYAVLRGDGHPMYEAVARESDAPFRTTHIIAPYLSTLAGGLLATGFFGRYAIVGFLVTGLADAVGEPIGVRFGKHRYRVPSIRGVVAYRSYEGSAAVFIASIIALGLGVFLCPVSASPATLLLAVPAIALACTICEALSPHGLDNFFLQVLPTWMICLVGRI